MAEAPSVGYYNPNLRKQGAKTRRLASERADRRTAEQDPRTYGFVSGLMGENYGSSPISVLDPKRAKSQKAQDVGMAVGTALEVVPGLAALRKPAVKAGKAVGKSALKAVNDANMYGDGFLGPLTPQVNYAVEPGPKLKTSPYTQEVLPAAEREANLQKMQEESGAPGDWFHGTSRDIKEFKPQQADATFLSKDPNFVEDYAYNSNAWMGENVREFLTPEQIEAAKPKAVQLMKNRYGGQNKPHQKSLEAEIKNEGKGDLHASGEALDYLNEAYKDMMPSGPNIMKVHLGVKKPWDYENPEHVEDLLDEVNGDPRFANLTREQLSSGSWERIEGPGMQKAIRDLGYDAFYVNEGGVKNIGVYDPAKIKSATGNVGTYDLDNPEINKKAGGSVKLSRYSKQR